jgi:hypothetical protein
LAANVGKKAASLSAFSCFWQGGFFYDILPAILKMGVIVKMW